MRTFKYVLTWMVLLTIACTPKEAQRAAETEVLETKRPEATMKTQAEEMALRYIRTFFEGDCEQSLSMMSDTLIDLRTFESLSKESLRLGLCSSISQAVKDPGRTFGDYVNTYHITLRSAEEMRASFPDALPDAIQNGDHFFDGHHLKEEYQDREHFVWPAAFTFLLRKEEGYWKIKGLGALED